MILISHRLSVPACRRRPLACRCHPRRRLQRRRPARAPRPSARSRASWPCRSPPRRAASWPVGRRQHLWEIPCSTRPHVGSSKGDRPAHMASPAPRAAPRQPGPPLPSPSACAPEHVRQLPCQLVSGGEEQAVGAMRHELSDAAVGERAHRQPAPKHVDHLRKPRAGWSWGARVDTCPAQPPQRRKLTPSPPAAEQQQQRRRHQRQQLSSRKGRRAFMGRSSPLLEACSDTPRSALPNSRG